MPSVSQKDIMKYRSYCDHARQIRDRYNDCSRWSRYSSFPLQDIDNLDHYPPAQKYRSGNRQSFERIFHSHVERHNTSASRVFRGRNWSRITAIPLYDMPQRMSGILFINGHKSPIYQTTIRRLGPKNPVNYSFDPGYLATSQLLDTTRPAEFVMFSTHWKQVLRFQADIAYQEQSVAPVVGWFPNDPMTGKLWNYRWSFFQDVPRIFWSWPGDMISLREACLTGSRISHAYFKPQSGVCELPDLLSGAVIRSIGRGSISWQKALCWFLDDGRESVTDKLDGLKLPENILEQFLPYAPGHIRRMIQEKYLSTNSTTKHIDNFVVTGNADGWFQASADPNTQPTLLSSARCFIDRALSIAGKEPLYQGRILLRDESFPFLEPCSLVEKNVNQFIHRICIEHKAQRLPVIMTTPEKMLKVVRCHANFQVKYIANGFGWDNESGSLILPNITLSDNQCLDSELRLDYGPFSSLRTEHCEPLTRQDMNILASLHEESPYVLAILVSMLPVLFAPAYRMETPQTTIPGFNTELLQQLFKFLRLPQSAKGVTANISDYAETHLCPYFVKLNAQSPFRRNRDTPAWVDSIGLYGCGYVASSLPTVLARMTLGHANILFLPKLRFYLWIKEKLPEVYLKCLALTLKYFSRYVLEPRVQSDNWNNDLIDEAIRFFEQTLGLPVHKGTLYEGYYDPSSYFCDFVNLLQQYEELKVAVSEEGLVIPVNALGDCYRKTIGVFDFDHIKTMLTTTMLLKHYDPSKHVFLVNKDMFQASQKRLETIYSLYIR